MKHSLKTIDYLCGFQMDSSSNAGLVQHHSKNRFNENNPHLVDILLLLSRSSSNQPSLHTHLFNVVPPHSEPPQTASCIPIHPHSETPLQSLPLQFPSHEPNGLSRMQWHRDPDHACFVRSPLCLLMACMMLSFAAPRPSISCGFVSRLVDCSNRRRKDTSGGAYGDEMEEFVHASHMFAVATNPSIRTLVNLTACECN